MPLPLVSILIPLYNSQDYIEETINSCLNQSYHNIEIIIVDDGSTDNSFDIVKKYEGENVKIFQQKNKGGGNARNYAFEMCSGDYIQYLDADDLISYDKIEKQINLLKTYNFEKDIICFVPFKRLDNNDEFHEILSNKFIYHHYDAPIQLLIDFWNHRLFLPSNSYLFHRDLQILAGGWNELLRKNQDGEFFARIISISEKILFSGEGEAIYRKVPDSVSKRLDIDALKSQLSSYKIVSNILLNYDSGEEVKSAIVNHYCCFLYWYYPYNKPLIREVTSLIKKYKVSVIFPDNGKLFNFLRKIIGWEYARIVTNHKFITNAVKCLRDWKTNE